ncbi:MAG TPA: ABC transporter ATP-binding protein [bacterium]|jgi:ATP-binding cassette subfamily B multidrug efflux pump|nr:ABC transporter ATP-binding protein [bacterium]
MNAFRHLIPHFKKQRRLFVVGVLALLLTDLAEQYLPRLLKLALDELYKAKAGPGAERAALDGVLLWIGLRLGLVALEGGLRWGWRMGFFGMGRHVEYGMRRQLFGKLLTLDSGFFRRLRVGDLLSRAMSDLVAVRESLGFGWLALVDGVTMVTLTIAFMMRANALLTAQMLWPMVFVPFLVVTLGRKVRDNERAAQALLDSLSQTATESFHGVRVIHAYARQADENRRFDAACEAYRARNMRLVKVEAVYWPLLSFLSGACELLLFYFGGRDLAARHITLGDFAMFQAYLLNITWPVMALGVSSNSYVKGKVSMQRLNEVYDAAPAIQDGPEKAVRPESPGRPVVEFRGVVCSYADGPDVIKGVDFSVRPGEWVGLASRLGGGKSTLLRLPLRLDDVKAGEVRLWGRDVRAWPLQALRRRVALVAQEPFLFSETVLENITFSFDGDPQERFEDAVAAARAADLHETVGGLPQGYATLLGEKGINLSGGQKQRVALARALFAKPDLLLLDDAFSAVDTGTEERIAPALRRALPEAAVIMVSHRVSTLRLCDRVLVLEDGRITAEGSPDELMQQEGYFFEMARREHLARRIGLEA